MSDADDWIRSHRKPGVFADYAEPAEPPPDVLSPNFGIPSDGPYQGWRSPLRDDQIPGRGPSDEEWMRDVGREVVMRKRESRGRPATDER